MPLEGVEIRPCPAGARLKVRAHPRARRNGIDVGAGGVMRVSVTAAPDKGRANDAIERLLAGALGVPSTSVRIVAGLASRDKTVEIAGLAPDEVRRRLDGAVEG